MFKINLNTFKLNKIATIIMKTKFLRKITVDDQLFAVPIKYD